MVKLHERYQVLAFGDGTMRAAEVEHNANIVNADIHPNTDIAQNAPSVAKMAIFRQSAGKE